MEKKVKLSNKQYNEEVKAQIVELFEAKEDFKGIESEHKKKVEKLTVAIKNFMFVHGINHVTFKAFSGRYARGPKSLECKMVTPVSVEFIPEELEKRLGKEVATEFIDKEVVIENWNEFMEYMKDLGANPKKVKSFISVRKTVNKKALENAEKLGKVSVESLKGCYKTTKKSSYLKISEVEEDNEE